MGSFKVKIGSVEVERWRFSEKEGPGSLKRSG